MFVVGKAGWANLLARLRVRGGGFWRGGSCGHVRGGYVANHAGPPPCCMNVALHVGIRVCGAETSAWIPMIGGVDCGALSSGPVGGCKLEVGGS